MDCKSINPDLVMAAVLDFIADHEELQDDAFVVAKAPTWDEDSGRWEVPAEDKAARYVFTTVPDGSGEWKIRLECCGTK